MAVDHCVPPWVRTTAHGIPAPRQASDRRRGLVDAECARLWLVERLGEHVG